MINRRKRPYILRNDEYKFLQLVLKRKIEDKGEVEQWGMNRQRKTGGLIWITSNADQVEETVSKIKL